MQLLSYIAKAKLRDISVRIKSGGDSWQGYYTSGLSKGFCF
jgi:hypothetical protein